MEHLQQQKQHQDHFIDHMINEHGVIMPALVKFKSHIISGEDPRKVARDALQFYYNMIRPHSNREDAEVIRKNPGMDVEGVLMSHRRLEEACDKLEQVFFNPGTPFGQMKSEAIDFIDANINHIREEENQFFVTDLQDIYERAGSY